MSSSENDTQEFDTVLQDIQEYITSLEITDYQDTFYKHNTVGTTDEMYSHIKKLTYSDNVCIVHNITYEGMKYMHLKTIQDEGKMPVYIYISTDTNKTGMKKGMFITCFFSYSFIATFDHKKINGTTSKIISVLDQYQVDE